MFPFSLILTLSTLPLNLACLSISLSIQQFTSTNSLPFFLFLYLYPIHFPRFYATPRAEVSLCMTFGWHSVTTLLVLTFAGRVTSLPVLILGQVLFLEASLYHAHVPLSTRPGRWARSLCFVYSRIFSVQFFFFLSLSFYPCFSL